MAEINDATGAAGSSANILVIDIGGNNVKLYSSTAREKRKFPSGPGLTPQKMVAGVNELTSDWPRDVISLGYPGPVLHQRIATEPHNLGRGWAGFDFAAAFERPVKLINDAAMQALGGYEGGKMLFLGLGTGLGTAMIVDGMVEPMELAHETYRNATFEDYIGRRALQRNGEEVWRAHVVDVVECLRAALQPDDILIGGGNVKKLDELPPGCRRGSNAHAFTGGIRMWRGVGAAPPAGRD